MYTYQRFPLLSLLPWLIAGILLQWCIRVPLHILLVVFWVLFGCFLGYHWYCYKKIIVNGFLGIMMFILVFVSGLVVWALTHPLNYTSHYTYHLPNNPTHITGFATERLKPSTKYERYIFEIESVNEKSCFGKLIVQIPRNGSIHIGTPVLLYGNIAEIPEAKNPNQFNYNSYMQHRQVYKQMYVQGTHNLEGAYHRQYYVERFRNYLINGFAHYNLPSKDFAILKALVFGQRQDLDTDLMNQYSQTGVIHVLAISGLHIGVIYGFVAAIVRRLRVFKRFKTIVYLGIPLVIIWGFAVLSGFSASVVRAVVMFSFLGIAHHFKYSYNGLNALAGSMFVLLLYNPNYIFDVGFQLSYTAVFFIIWMQPLLDYLPKYKSFLYQRFVQISYMSFAAQIGVLPLSLYYFHQMPLLFWVANLIVIPLSSFILMLAFVFTVVNPFLNAQVQQFLGNILHYLLGWMNAWVGWLEHFEKIIKGIHISIPQSILLYMCIVFGIGFAVYQRKKMLFLALATLIIFQISVTVERYGKQKSSEFIVFSRKEPLYAQRLANKVTIYGSADLKKDPIIATYTSVSDVLEQKPLGNVWIQKENKILRIDSLGVYPTGITPEIIILSGSPKINFERLVAELQPKVIVIEPSNARYLIKQWEKKALNTGVLIHNIYSQGYFRVSNPIVGQ